jgi:protein-tyrosine phosphatase
MSDSPAPHTPTELRASALAEGIPAEDLPTRDPGTDRRVAFEGPLNFRDVGGYVGLGGRLVRRNLLFRSDHLNELTDADRAAMVALDLRVIHDFRLDIERERQPSLTTPGAYEVILLTMSDTSQVDSSMIDVIRDALAGRAPLPGPSFWESSYSDLLDVGRPMFVTLIESLTRPDRLPAMYHCTGGKDRTGLATTMVLQLLGVDQDTIVDDFLLTNLYRTPTRIAVLRDGFLAAGVDPAAAIPILGVTRAAVLRALAELETKYGGVEQYLIDGGLDPARFEVLRALLLE